MIREIVPPDTRSAFAAMQELRPHLSESQSFSEQVDTLQRPAGYRLAGVFESDETSADAVVGFRLLDSLAWGRAVYVDDLSTRAAARRRGHGRRLLDWVHSEAARVGCDGVHLDSGVGPTRGDAHRLYLNAGYVISSHHFARGT